MAIATVRNPNGSLSYRVTGTLRAKGKQRKALFQNWEDAVATQTAWESERVLNGAASRPKITRLTQQELIEAEAAFAFLKDTGMTLLDVVRNALRGAATPTTQAAASVNLDAARAAFLQEREPFVGKRRLESLRITISQFESFAGGGSPLATLTTADVLGWLKSKVGMSKKSWNNYRNDLSTFFAWCAGRPRSWIKENPVEPVPKHRIVRAMPERLEIETVRELMTWIESEKPAWCTFFTLALFLGIRPDMTDGEIAKLATVIGRDGVNRYYCNGVFHVTGEVAKDKRHRQVVVPANVAEWVRRYPLTPASICPGDWDDYQTIRERFKIPHDGLRHTAISAHVSMHGSFAEAAAQFGNSETVIRTHYFNRMSREEAEAFYAVGPKKCGDETPPRESR